MEYREEDKSICEEELREDYTLHDRRLKLFEENKKLAYLVGHKFHPSLDGVIDFEDIMQESLEGLWRACISFDPSKGYTFSTYAIPTIQGHVLRALRNNNQLRVPRSFLDIRAALNKHEFTLPLTDEEISVLVEEGKFSRKQIMDYAEPEIFSIDKADSSDKDPIRFSDMLSDTHANDYQDRLSEDELEAIIDQILRYIKPKRRDMVEEWIYAVLSGEKITYAQLGRKYGISRTYANVVIDASISIFQMHQDKILEILG